MLKQGKEERKEEKRYLRDPVGGGSRFTTKELLKSLSLAAVRWCRRKTVSFSFSKYTEVSPCHRKEKTFVYIKEVKILEASTISVLFEFKA